MQGHDWDTRNDCFTSFISPTVNNKNSSYIKSQHVCCLQEPGEEKLTRHELCFIRRFTHLRAQNRCCRQMLAADAVHSGISKGLVWMTLNATLTELNCSKHPEKWRETNSSLQQMRLRSARAETSEQLQQRTSAGSPGPLPGLPDLPGLLGVSVSLDSSCRSFAHSMQICQKAGDM